MERYFAPCGLGLEPALTGELEALGAADVVERRGGVAFRGEPDLGRNANLWLRTAIRVQLEVAQRRVRDERGLYELVREQEWERFVGPDGTLVVDAALRDSFLTHSGFAAQLVKDGVVDRFRERTGRRPSVSRDAADLPIKLVLQRDVATLYVDRSGDSLHKRGYRPVQVKSPLNEALAAGLLLLSGWDRRSPLVDPMAGSGTFLIEAAHLAGDRAPGLGRAFAFEFQADHDTGRWEALRAAAVARAERGRLQVPPIAGADRHPGAVALARRAIEAAGCGDLVRLAQGDVAHWEPPVAPAIVVTNPPYGERLGEGADLERSWRALGEFLRRQPRCIAWVLSGNPELTRHLRLSASRRIPVRNGPIDCRFLRYEVGRR